MDDDEFMPWESDGQATAPREEITPLEQLQKYQYVIRHICPLLDAYETAVLIQIVDRISGWKKLEARFGADKLLGGDRMYGGIARTMHRSRMMKALESLERRGVINRRSQSSGSPVRIYAVNYDVDLLTLERSAPRLRVPRKPTPRELKVSNRDHPVSQADYLVSKNDPEVSQEDTREKYLEKDILTSNPDNTQPELSAPAARSRNLVLEEEGGRDAQAHPGDRPEIRARVRRRNCMD